MPSSDARHQRTHFLGELSGSRAHTGRPGLSGSGSLGTLWPSVLGSRTSLSSEICLPVRGETWAELQSTRPVFSGQRGGAGGPSTPL